MNRTFFRLNAKPKINQRRDGNLKNTDQSFPVLPVLNQEDKSASVSATFASEKQEIGKDGAIIFSKDQGCEGKIGQRIIKADTVTNFEIEIKVTAKPDKPNINSISSTIDYPAPPPSPNKISRDRIKAVPKFQESDETRLHGRTRNISVCSVTSTATEGTSAQPALKEIWSAPKKINKSGEQSRRFTDARLEFQKRFGRRNPDKQKLKMIDLIFYNPSTNPMVNTKKKKDKSLTSEEHENDVSLSNAQSERSEKKLPENNDESDMPVPQIKIGPSGDIILDEKSLLIENKETTKDRETLEKSDLINGDFETGYGIYKRLKRSKEWTRKETLRFYKALNVIGTDFSLMLELFPKRSRRELKTKFKKEERINRHLIDRALTQPSSYNFSELKFEVHVDEQEEIELKKIKDKEDKERLEKKLENYRKKQLKTSEMSEIIKGTEESTKEKNKMDSLVEEDSIVTVENGRKRVYEGSDETLKRNEQEEATTSSQVRRRLKKKCAKRSSENCKGSEESTESDSESETISSILTPTRSGRVPKATQDFVHLHLVSTTNTAKQQLVTTNSEPDDLIPGSIMVVREESSLEKSTYKTFMVTPDKSLVPLELESDVISKVIDFKKIFIDRPEEVETPVEECNVTIPANNVVENLKTQ